MDAADIQAILLTLKLALISTLILILLALPLAWWLSQTKSRLKPWIVVVTTLPLVLPPTVLGFYLLVALGPQGWIGGVLQSMGLNHLAFSFPGLVIGSVIYSLPFAIQPLLNAFGAIPKTYLEAAFLLKASAIDRFFTVALPLAKQGLITAIVLSFAHTLGEFGVVLMIGGNIPGETQVISIAIYDHVESLNYSKANLLAAGLVIFSLVVLLLVNRLQTNLRLMGGPGR